MIVLIVQAKYALREKIVLLPGCSGGQCSIHCRTNQTHNFAFDLTNQLVIRLTNNHRPLTQYTYWVPVCL